VTPDGWLVLLIIAASIALFLTEWLAIDVVALCVMISLGFSGILTLPETFAGFSSPAVVTVWSVFIVSAGLFRTGVASRLGRLLLRLSGPSEVRLIALSMLFCGTMSAFINNIGAVAILLPTLVEISRKTRIPISRLLIPLAFSSLLGGNATLIGTPPNVLAADMLQTRGLGQLGFFDFTPLGLIVFATGIVFMVTVGRFLLPRREARDLQDDYELKNFVSEVKLDENSVLLGRTLGESNVGAKYDLTVVAIIRQGRRISPSRDTMFEAQDILLIESSPEALLSNASKLGLVTEAKQELKLADPAQDAFIVEAVLAPGNSMAGKSLKDLKFRESFGFTALAIRHHGKITRSRVSRVKLNFGDSLLLQGNRQALERLRDSRDFLLLEPLPLELPRRRHAVTALAILALVLLLTTVFQVSVALAMLSAAVLMVLTGCLTMDEAHQSIQWNSVFLIAGMLPLGTALEKTGAANYLALQILHFTSSFGHVGVLAGVYLFTALLTQALSNAAATVLIVPIAIDIALNLGVSPYPFVLATVIGASNSFLTPVGHQANVLVMGPGNYRFSDYAKVGLPLMLVILVVSMMAIPFLWPFKPA